jgi:hypothetical protein
MTRYANMDNSPALRMEILNVEADALVQKRGYWLEAGCEC